MKKRGVASKVEAFIANSEAGVTINELAEHFQISRNSIVIELARLEGAQRVQFRQVGNVKLYTAGGKK